jgi:hypothetical protein
MIRKSLLRLLLASLVLTAAIALEPAPAYTLGFCANYDDRFCFNENQTILCTWIGCCGYLDTRSCVCVDGHWDCPDSPECPPDYC